MSLIDCEINLILTWSKNCVISSATGKTKFAITDTKIYVLIVTLSNQDNAKLLEQVTSGFKRTINWNKYQSKTPIERPNGCLDYLIDPSFQGVNRVFVLSFDDNAHRTRHTGCFLPKVELEKYNVMSGR